ncbi:unnamed protein product [Euphydryas editha]|uniref:Uncharacterized protein n=1 Tax=Euphydryas editha TaxID=104508 RepID=A0AAU9UFD5_EUPED|nr:unnamed protein product [Euphydryas editha]
MSRSEQEHDDEYDNDDDDDKWRTCLGKGSVKRLRARWSDDIICKVGDIDWNERAGDRGQWRAIEEAYVQQ